MLEAKNDNKDRDDIDIVDNTSGTVGFDPKTGKVFFVDEPKVEKSKAEEEIDDLTAQLDKASDEIADLLKSVGIDDLTDMDALKKLAENED
ncbi:hypothetical protein NH286_08360 [Anaerococcus sp. NML200574]|uniref:Uncharacterized protein n=1 Tax=Anaerococcus kampingae TaxID=3115614 RepID=A0ABW9MBX7_9FIRM|nr:MULTISPECIES: hypothetical protein [unclassified Anaerococcus]MCW6679166.1 hypothetical protein [Anaerococcus sp. NML200574]MCW6702438.1 hypothetical protein [Anaerococcus sp. NML200537]